MNDGPMGPFHTGVGPPANLQVPSPGTDVNQSQFQFEDNGRSFRCERGASPAAPGTLWWWVNISGESQRYAAFRSEKGDTETKVRTRVIAYRSEEHTSELQSRFGI